MHTATTIQFDSRKLAKLKKAYKVAKQEHVDVFQFEGKDVVTDYAKYLIEYLDSKLR